MLKDVCEKYYLGSNYNCAEAIIRAGNEYYNLGLHENEMKMMGGYGAGIQCGASCGAVLSGVAILSLKYIETCAHESEDIRPVTLKLIKEFKNRYGSILCKDIKPQSFTPELRCKNTVETACDILESVLADYEQNK